MTNKDKALAVLLRIRDLCNQGHQVSFTGDWGGTSGQNTLTVVVDDQHFHTGSPGATEKDLIESLHSRLNYPLYTTED